MLLKVNPGHHALPRICRATSCAGGGAAASEELLEHQGLVGGAYAHAHAFGDERAQALVGGGGGRGMGASWLG